jgi:DHHC palmitoyltransferase
MSETDGLLHRSNSKSSIEELPQKVVEEKQYEEKRKLITTISKGRCTCVILTIPFCRYSEEFIIGPDYQGIVASITVITLVLLLCIRLIYLKANEQLGALLAYVELAVLIILVSTTCYYYGICSLRDPGFLLVDFNYPPEAKLGYLCVECGLQKSRDYTHCFDCGLCVRDRENHCAWIGKCIGSKTSAHFKHFTFACTVLMCYIGLLFGLYTVHFNGN